jgi:hypothetical protein
MPEVFCGVIFGIVMILISLANIFLKDWTWNLTEWSNRVGGRVSQRTREWEIMTTIVGTIGVVTGIALIIWVLKTAYS